MRWGAAYSRLSPSQRAGIVAAAASVPMSLVPLLKPRSAVDQGLITGVSSAVDYALTSGMHDAVLSTSRGALRLVGRDPDVRTTARATLAIDGIALATSLAAEAVLRRTGHRRTVWALTNAGARRVRGAAIFGLVSGALDAIPDIEGQKHPVTRVLHTVPAAIATGTAMALGVQYVRRQRAKADGAELGRRTAPTLKSLGVAAVAATGAAAIAAGEREIAAGPSASSPAPPGRRATARGSATWPRSA